MEKPSVNLHATAAAVATSCGDTACIVISVHGDGFRIGLSGLDMSGAVGLLLAASNHMAFLTQGKLGTCH